MSTPEDNSSRIVFNTNTARLGHAVGIDIGSEYTKVVYFIDGEIKGEVTRIPSKLAYIGKADVERSKELTDGMTSLKVGIYTKKQIDELSLVYQKKEEYVQRDNRPTTDTFNGRLVGEKEEPMITTTDLLSTFYKDVLERTEHIPEQYGVSPPMTQPSVWGIFLTIAAFENFDAFQMNKKEHIDSFFELGFNHVYVTNQLNVDHMSQLNHIKRLGGNAFYCLLVNIGAGDIEVGAVSNDVLASTFVRAPIAGRLVSNMFYNGLREAYSFKGTPFRTIEEWIHRSGTVWTPDHDNYPYHGQKKEETFGKQTINITPYVHYPALLFNVSSFTDAADPRYNSITEVIIASIYKLAEITEAPLDLIVQSIIIVGGAALYEGLIDRLEEELKNHKQLQGFKAEDGSDLRDRIKCHLGEDAQNSGIRGIALVLQRLLGTENSPGLPWVVPSE